MSHLHMYLVLNPLWQKKQRQLVLPLLQNNRDNTRLSNNLSFLHLYVFFMCNRTFSSITSIFVWGVFTLSWSTYVIILRFPSPSVWHHKSVYLKPRSGDYELKTKVVIGRYTITYYMRGKTRSQKSGHFTCLILVEVYQWYFKYYVYFVQLSDHTLLKIHL